MSSKDTTEVRSIQRAGLMRFGPARRWRRYRYEQIEGLLALAEELQGILVPVQPETRYRRRLHGELILASQSRERHVATDDSQRRKGILLGAAALGSVASVAGVIIAFVLHSKNSRARQAAAG